MPPDSRDRTDRAADVAASVWDRIRNHLEAHRDRLFERIKEYPSPIAACDLQFSYLLEEQGNILRELARLNDAAARSLAADDPAEAIEAFIRSSGYLDAGTCQALLSDLAAGGRKGSSVRGAQ